VRVRVAVSLGCGTWVEESAQMGQSASAKPKSFPVGRRKSLLKTVDAGKRCEGWSSGAAAVVSDASSSAAAAAAAAAAAEVARSAPMPEGVM
jgi:hypothetical protein